MSTSKKVVRGGKPRKSPKAKASDQVDAAACDGSCSLSKQNGHIEVVMDRQQPAMLAVSFEEAMQVRSLLGEVSKQAQTGLISHLAHHGGDGLAIGLTGARVLIERGTEVVRFSAKGAKLLKAKELRFMTDATGRKIPTLVNASGKTVENARVMGTLTTGTRIAANLTIAVVTAAHIISGADLAKKLNNLASKVEFLVAAHRIEQLSRVEGVYRQAKELMHLSQTDQTRIELHRLGRELFEVRSAWRREIVHHVGNLEKTEESKNWFVGRFQRLTRKGKDEKVSKTVSATEAEIQLLNGSLAIHLALAQAAGTLDTFLQVSLPDELSELQRVHDFLEDRQQYIHDKHPELRNSVTDACSRLEAVTTTYRSMVMPMDHLADPAS